MTRFDPLTETGNCRVRRLSRCFVRCLTLLVATAATACDSPDRSPYLFRDAGRLEEHQAADSGKVGLELVRTWGAAVGSASFSAIGPVAISEGGVLAAYDTRACEIALFDLTSSQFLGRIGRCGEGPGDFSRVSGIGFGGAGTIVVYDGPARRLHFLSATGEELRRIPVGFANEHGGVQALFFLPGDTLIASRSFMGAATLTGAVGPDRKVLARATLDPPSITATSIDFPAVMDKHRGNLQAGYATCVRPGNGQRRVALMNRWAFESVILDAGHLTPVARHVTQLEWGAPRESPEEPGVMMPYGGIPSATCSDEWVMFSQIKLAGEGRDLRPDGGYVEIRDYDGNLIASTSLSPTDSMWFGLPVAARGDRVFFRVNREAPFPQIQEYRLSLGRSLSMNP